MTDILAGLDFADVLGPFRGGPRGWNLQIYGLARTQAAMIRNARRVMASSGLRSAWNYLGPEMLDYARRITHKWTGALAASHRLDTKIGGTELWGLLYVDPKARNPITHAPVTEYAGIEHARGFSHAYYKRTFEHFRKRAGYEFMDHIYSQLEDK